MLGRDPTRNLGETKARGPAADVKLDPSVVPHAIEGIIC
jgi:hypothetical protein